MKKFFFSCIFTVCFVGLAMAQQTPQIAKQKKLHSISSQEQNQKIIELKKNEASNKKSDFIIEPEQNTTEAVISKPKKKLSN